MKNNPVGWFEIYVDDMNRAKTFYEAVFESKLEKLNAPSDDLEMWNFPMSRECTEENSGAAGALVHMPGCKAGGGGTIVYFVCDDCATEAGRVESAGGKIFKPKFPIGPYGFISLVIDTEGNMIGLHSMK